MVVAQLDTSSELAASPREGTAWGAAHPAHSQDICLLINSCVPGKNGTCAGCCTASRSRNALNVARGGKEQRCPRSIVPLTTRCWHLARVGREWRQVAVASQEGASRAGAAAHPFLAVIDNGIPLQMPHPHMPALSTGATPSALAANGHFALQRSSSPARQPRCIEGGPCYTATGLPRAWQPHQCRGSMAVARRGNRNAGRGCGVGAANWLATLHMPAPLQKGG